MMGYAHTVPLPAAFQLPTSPLDFRWSFFTNDLTPALMNPNGTSRRPGLGWEDLLVFLHNVVVTFLEDFLPTKKKKKEHHYTMTSMYGVYYTKKLPTTTNKALKCTYIIYPLPPWMWPDHRLEAEPYALGWCRPQTDGPPLRARTLMQAARRWRRHAGGGSVRFLLGLLVGDDRFFVTKMR